MRTFYDAFQDPEEQPFIVALMNDNSDAGARSSYAEWLARRDDPRAELVGIANQLLAGVVDSAERRRLAGRLVEVRDQVDEMLARLLLSPLSVRNCGEPTSAEPRVRFAFQCPMTWGEMKPTADDKLRFCERCSTAVVRCDTLAEAERQALLGACISVDGRLMGEANEKFCRNYTGRPDVVAIWAERLFK